MRVWLITVGEPIPPISGSGRPLRTGILARQLAEEGHDVVWWTSTVDHFGKRRFARGNLRHLEPGVGKGKGYAIHLVRGLLYRKNVSLVRLLHNVHTAWNFRRWIADLDPPDVIMASLPTVELCHEAMAYADDHDVPVVVDVRDLWPSIWVDRLPGGLRPLGRGFVAPWAWLTRDVLRRADAVTAVSETYLRWALRSAGEERDGGRHHVIPLGYQPPRCIPGEVDDGRRKLREAGVDPERFIAWFVGSFGVSYDLVAVVDAAHVLAREGRSPQIVISGQGEQEAELRRRAADLPDVVFTGWLGSAEIAAMMEWSDVGLAAYGAGAPQVMPNKIYEYMAGGLPLIHSLPGETREILDRHGCAIFYPAGDAEALARQIERLMEEPERRAAMAAASRWAFQEHYRADRILEKVTKVLQRAVDRRGQA